MQFAIPQWRTCCFRFHTKPIVLLAACLLAATSSARAQTEDGIRPEEVLVVANGGSLESLEVARYYMSQRGIPASHLVTLDFAGYRHPVWISHEEFLLKALKPLQSFLEQNGLRDQILCLVTCYDVPLRVRGPTLLKSDRPEVERLAGAEIRRRLEATIKQLQSVPSLSDEEKAARVQKMRDDAQRSIGRQADMLMRDSRASFDSELAWLFRSELEGLRPEEVNYKIRFGFWTRNPYAQSNLRFRQFRQQQIRSGRKDRLYMTARLDGPTPQVARGLVDRARQAEREGPRGKGYFDARRPTRALAPTGYDLGEFWCRRAYIETINAGFSAVLDEQQTRFSSGQCPDALFYWGWYNLQGYENVFQSRFPAGAIAVHTASGEATTLRANLDSGGPWCSGFLKHGATVCVGPVAEPFLGAFPRADQFFPAIYSGWTVGEAYWRSIDQVSWMMVLVGDPLYAPFAGKNALRDYVRGVIVFRAPGQAQPSRTPAGNRRSQLQVQLVCQQPVFQNPQSYRILDPKTNAAEVKLLDLDQATFRVLGDGKVLQVEGISLELGKLPANQLQELELHIDLAKDGGRKIISQPFLASPSAH